jgi:hypothetical protein
MGQAHDYCGWGLRLGPANGPAISWACSPKSNRGAGTPWRGAAAPADFGGEGSGGQGLVQFSNVENLFGGRDEEVLAKNSFSTAARIGRRGTTTMAGEGVK